MGKGTTKKESGTKQKITAWLIIERNGNNPNGHAEASDRNQATRKKKSARKKPWMGKRRPCSVIQHYEQVGREGEIPALEKQDNLEWSCKKQNST